jgi:trimethylguanosine synthase
MAKKRKRQSERLDQQIQQEQGGAATKDQDLSALAVTSFEKLPKNTRKYWYNRYQLFSRYDEGILLDLQSWFSVTPEAIAARIAARCCSSTMVRSKAESSTMPRKTKQAKATSGGTAMKAGGLVVLDLFCGAGGNAIQFAVHPDCSKVIAIDIDPIKVKLARHNAEIYGIQDKILFLTGDALEFVKSCREVKAGGSVDVQRWQGTEQMNIDVVFLSPPWGGVGYDKLGQASPNSQTNSRQRRDERRIRADQPTDLGLPTSFATPAQARQAEEESAAANEDLYDYYSLANLNPVSGTKLFEAARSLSENVCFYLPRNCDLYEIAELVPSVRQGVEKTIAVEEQFQGQGYKALTCYFGALIDWTEGEEDVQK